MDKKVTHSDNSVSTIYEGFEKTTTKVDVPIKDSTRECSSQSEGFEKTTTKVDVPIKDSTSECSSQSKIPVCAKSSATVNDRSIICSEVDKDGFTDTSSQFQPDDYSKSTYLTTTLTTLNSVPHEAKHWRDKLSVRLSESNKRTFQDNEKKKRIDHIKKEQTSVDKGKRRLGFTLKETHDISNRDLVS